MHPNSFGHSLDRLIARRLGTESRLLLSYQNLTEYSINVNLVDFEVKAQCDYRSLFNEGFTPSQEQLLCTCSF